MCWGRSMSCRPARVDVVHWVRTGHCWQAVVGKPHDDASASVRDAGRPDGGGHILWAGHPLVIPVDVEPGTAEPAAGLGLRGAVGVERTGQRDLMLAGGFHEQVGGGVAAVHDVFARA